MNIDINNYNISFIKYKNIKIYINEIPNDNLNFLNFLKINNINYIVKLCEETNNCIQFIKKNKNIHFNELIFCDGSTPNNKILNEWLKIVKKSINDKSNIFIHCFSGLGRAPLLVCILLIINTDEPSYIIIENIRKIRKNALNKKQITYLMKKKWRNNKFYCCFIQ